METRITEISPDIFRLSTLVSDIAPPVGFVFNQFLVRSDDALLFHTGPRRMFPLVHAAVARLIRPEQLRWITFGHYEADECGSMNDWLAAAPRAEIAHGATASNVSLNDMADRPPRILQDGEVIDLGSRRIRYLDTPHVPHGWEAGLIHEETSGVLFCGDLFTQLGDRMTTESDIVGPAIQAEDLFHASSLNPGMGATIRKLGALAPRTLALMHGPAFTGDCNAALGALADDYDARVIAAMKQAAVGRAA
jgi:flavorubredoxin